MLVRAQASIFDNWFVSILKTGTLLVKMHHESRIPTDVVDGSQALYSLTLCSSGCQNLALTALLFQPIMLLYGDPTEL